MNNNDLRNIAFSKMFLFEAKTSENEETSGNESSEAVEGNKGESRDEEKPTQVQPLGTESSKPQGQSHEVQPPPEKVFIDPNTGYREARRPTPYYAHPSSPETTYTSEIVESKPSVTQAVTTNAVDNAKEEPVNPSSAPEFYINHGAGYETKDKVSRPDLIKEIDINNGINFDLTEKLRRKDKDFIKQHTADGGKIVSYAGEFYVQDGNDLYPLELSNPELSQFEGALGVSRNNGKYVANLNNTVKNTPYLPIDAINKGRAFKDDEGDWRRFNSETGRFELTSDPTVDDSRFTPGSVSDYKRGTFGGSSNLVNIESRNANNMQAGINSIVESALKTPGFEGILLGRPGENYHDFQKRMGNYISYTALQYGVDPQRLGDALWRRGATVQPSTSSSTQERSTSVTTTSSQPSTSPQATQITEEQIRNNQNIPDLFKQGLNATQYRQKVFKDKEEQKKIWDAFQNRNKDDESRKAWNNYVALLNGIDPSDANSIEKVKKSTEADLEGFFGQIDGEDRGSLYFKGYYQKEKERIMQDQSLSEDQKKARIQELENLIGKTEADAMKAAQRTAMNLTREMWPGKDENLDAWWGRLSKDQKTGLLVGGGVGLLSFLMMMGKEEKDVVDWMLGLGLPVVSVGAGAYFGNAGRANPKAFNKNIYEAYMREHGVTR